MAIWDRKALRRAAAETLNRPENDPKRLVVIHAGATALLSLGIAAADYLLQQKIAGTSGLGGLGSRSMLQTLREVLSLLSVIFPLFWNMGYVHICLRMAGGGQVQDRDLLQGFRKFGPVLRMNMLEALAGILISIPVVMVGSSLLAATPLGKPYLELIAQVMPKDGSELDVSKLDDATVAQITEAMTPVLIGCLILCAVVMIPVLYRLRLSRYFLMDSDNGSAVLAMVQSIRYTKGHCLQLLRLDLGFWWYFGLELLAAVVAYGDRLLPNLGISLPVSPVAAFFLFYALGLGLQTLLYYKAKNPVELTYVFAYRALAEEEPVQMAAEETKEELPWEDYRG